MEIAAGPYTSRPSFFYIEVARFTYFFIFLFLEHLWRPKKNLSN